ncbi:MAG TPA: efflux RND transporter periplasmic adaptor subunit [bacterium]
MKRPLQCVVILAITSALLGGCSNGPKKDFLGSGTLEAEEVIVSSLLPGTIEELLVSEGAAVQKDQIIARLDTSKLSAQRSQSEAALQEILINRRLAGNAIQQARTQYDNLAANLQRQQSLLQGGSSTQQIVDDLKAQEEIARLRLTSAQDQFAALDAKESQLRAALDLIDLQIEDAVIRSPLTGAVIEKYVAAGENVPLGGAIVKIADVKKLWIKIYLTERDVGLVALNAPVRVKVDAVTGHSFEGRVSWISPKAEFTPKNVQTRQSRADLVFAVKIEFDNPDGLAAIGMPAEVHLP